MCNPPHQRRPRPPVAVLLIAHSSLTAFFLRLLALSGDSLCSFYRAGCCRKLLIMGIMRAISTARVGYAFVDICRAFVRGVRITISKSELVLSRLPAATER